MGKTNIRIKVISFLAALLITPILFSQDEKSGSSDSDIVNMTFSDFKSWQEGSEQVYLFTGKPEITYKDTFMTADYIVVWGSATKEKDNKPEGQDKEEMQNLNLSSLAEFYAEGNIKLKRGDREIWGDRIFYNFKGEKGLILNFATKMFDKKQNLPRIIRAKEAREVYKDHYALKDASVTT